MENNSKKMDDGLVWFLLVLVVIGMVVMVWMGTKNKVQAPAEESAQMTPTPTGVTTTPSATTTPASNTTIDQKLKEVNAGGQDVDASFTDKPINVQ